MFKAGKTLLMDVGQAEIQQVHEKNSFGVGNLHIEFQAFKGKFQALSLALACLYLLLNPAMVSPRMVGGVWLLPFSYFDQSDALFSILPRYPGDGLCLRHHSSRCESRGHPGLQHG